MTSELTVSFVYEIGDIVFFRASQHCAGSRPKPFLITERVAQECHGGVQQLYRMDGRPDLVSEVALSHDEPPYRPMVPAAVDDGIKSEAQAALARDARWETVRGELKKAREAAEAGKET